MHVYLKGPAKSVRLTKRPPKKFAGVLSMLFLVLGAFLIFQAAWPVVSWYFLVMPGVNVRIISTLASPFGPLVRADASKSYNANAWFTKTAKVLAASAASIKTYTITIPKLKINAANVEVGGDLKKTLVAWPTSSMPGSWGNNIIFGHSELPQLASPSNYSGIFTFIMDLEENDDIFLDYDGVRYSYKVIDKKVVEPTDISVLEQRFDSAYVTLITCVPPGTLWKRGIIKAKIVGI